MALDIYMKPQFQKPHGIKHVYETTLFQKPHGIKHVYETTMFQKLHGMASDIYMKPHCFRNLLTSDIIIIDRFYIALFSALEQTHCARMWFYMSE